MINLILAVISSSLIAILMRAGENKISSKAGMFIANYFICAILARLYVGKEKVFSYHDGFMLTIGLGTICGILFLLSFLLLQVNINKNGIVLSSLFMKLGVVIPVIVAIAVFGEYPKLQQIMGIILTIVTILLINYKSGNDTKSNYNDATEEGVLINNARSSNPAEISKKSSRWLLLLLLIGGGTTDCLVNVYDKTGSADYSNNFLFFIFSAALISAVVMQLIQKNKITYWDLIWGCAIGIPNYFSSKFQLAALKTIPAVIVFPAYSVGTIVVIALVGIIFFSEKPDRNKLIAIIIAIAALILLNV